jgi:hypothetical protein
VGKGVANHAEEVGALDTAKAGFCSDARGTVVQACKDCINIATCLALCKVMLYPGQAAVSQGHVYFDVLPLFFQES